MSLMAPFFFCRETIKRQQQHVSGGGERSEAVFWGVNCSAERKGEKDEQFTELQETLGTKYIPGQTSGSDTTD